MASTAGLHRVAVDHLPNVYHLSQILSRQISSTEVTDEIGLARYINQMRQGQGLDSLPISTKRLYQRDVYELLDDESRRHVHVLMSANTRAQLKGDLTINPYDIVNDPPRVAVFPSNTPDKLAAGASQRDSEVS